MAEREWDRRRTGAALASLVGLSACAAIRPQRSEVLVNMAGQAAPAAPGEEAELALGADVAERLTVPVSLNDQGPFAFVVDTGANRTVVAAEVAGPLGLPSGGPAAIHGIAGVEPAETALIGKLAVGGLVTRRMRAPLLARRRLGADGLLGVDALKNRRVLIDFKTNNLTIGRADQPPAIVRGESTRLAPKFDPSVVVVPARYRFGQLIIIDADIGGLPVTAFLDSGSQNTVGNLALRRRMAAIMDPQRLAESTRVQLISATGQTAAGELLPVPTLRMGGLRIGHLSAVFADLHVFDIWDLDETPAILIGVDVMRNFDSIELNFGRRLVTFRTPPGAAAPAP